MKLRLIMFCGTRPELVKLVPLVLYGRESCSDKLDICFVNTGQHEHLDEMALDCFGVKFDKTLNFDRSLIKDLSLLNGYLQIWIGNFLTESMADHSIPHVVAVQGDTSTALQAGLAAFFLGVSVVHVESGLRTYNIKSPFPEEVNRQLLSRIATINFAPTEAAKANLLQEGVSSSSIAVTGNTAVDSVVLMLNKIKSSNRNIKDIRFFDIYGNHFVLMWRTFILFTFHRRENWPNIEEVGKAIIDFKRDLDIPILVCCHPNPGLKNYFFNKFAGLDDIFVIEPLPYDKFILTVSSSLAVFSDSGGIQEEIPTIGRKLVVLRENTERNEALSTGLVTRVSPNYQEIYNSLREVGELLEEVNCIKPVFNPFGDGHAGKKICLEIMSREWEIDR